MDEDRIMMLYALIVMVASTAGNPFAIPFVHTPSLTLQECRREAAMYLSLKGRTNLVAICVSEESRFL